MSASSGYNNSLCIMIYFSRKRSTVEYAIYNWLLSIIQGYHHGWQQQQAKIKVIITEGL